MAKVHHWKHGWIPLDAFARREAAKRGIKGYGPTGAKHGDSAAYRPNGTSPFSGSTASGMGKKSRKELDKENRAFDERTKPNPTLAFSPTNPRSLGEQVRPNPDEMLADARGGGPSYSAAHMTPDGRFTPEREALHRKIIEDHLRGIKPSGKQPVQFMNGGGPGSGKSSLRTPPNARITGYPDTREADDMTGKLDFGKPAGAVLIDPDAIKMMLPEVKQARAAGKNDWASKAHEESSYLAKRIHAAALDRGLDTLYDGTGDGGLDSVQKKINLAKAKGYRVEGNYIYLDPDEGVRRAESRGQRVGRVVPEAVIRETYKDVSNTFGQVAQSGDFDVLRVFDNNSKPAKLIAEIKPGQAPNVFDSSAYRRFLANGHSGE